jgi:hypothetical protein
MASAAVGAGSLVYNMTNKPKAPGLVQAEKQPDVNVFRDKNASNALVQGNAGTGTGSLLSGNAPGNMLFGQ